MNEKELIEKVNAILEELRRTVYVEEYQAEITKNELLGVLVSKFCEWSGDDILNVTEYALEDSNFHDLSGRIGDMRDDLLTDKN